MERKGSGLAARFRQALTDADQARRSDEDVRRAALEEARAARAALLDDLVAFAAESGFITARRDGDNLIFRFRERWLQFAAFGEGGVVKVTFEGTAADEEHRLYREPMLGDRWVWVVRRRALEDRTPLFDKGLEELLIRGLGLPRPGDAPPAPPAKPAVEAVKRKL